LSVHNVFCPLQFYRKNAREICREAAIDDDICCFIIISCGSTLANINGISSKKKTQKDKMKKEAATECSIELMVVKPVIQAPTSSFAKKNEDIAAGDKNGMMIPENIIVEPTSPSDDDGDSGIRIDEPANSKKKRKQKSKSQRTTRKRGESSAPLLYQEVSSKSWRGDDDDEWKRHSSSKVERKNRHFLRFLSHTRMPSTRLSNPASLASKDDCNYFNNHKHDHDEYDNVDPVKMFSPIEKSKKKTRDVASSSLSSSSLCRFKAIPIDRSSNSHKSESCTTTTTANTDTSIESSIVADEDTVRNESLSTAETAPRVNHHDGQPQDSTALSVASSLAARHSSQVEIADSKDRKDEQHINDDDDDNKPCSPVLTPRSLPTRLGSPNKPGRADQDHMTDDTNDDITAPIAAADIKTMRSISRVHRSRLRSLQQALLLEGRDDDDNAADAIARRCRSLEKQQLFDTIPEEEGKEIEWTPNAKETVPLSNKDTHQPPDDQKPGATSTYIGTRRETTAAPHSKYNKARVYSNATTSKVVHNTVCANMLASCRLKAKSRNSEKPQSAAEVAMYHNKTTTNNKQEKSTEVEPKQQQVGSPVTFDDAAAADAVILTSAVEKSSLGAADDVCLKNNTNSMVHSDVEKRVSSFLTHPLQIQKPEWLSSLRSSSFALAAAADAAKAEAAALMSGSMSHLLDFNNTNASAAITLGTMKTINGPETAAGGGGGGGLFARSLSCPLFAAASDRRCLVSCEKSEAMKFVGRGEEEKVKTTTTTTKTLATTSLASPTGPLQELMSHLSLANDHGDGGASYMSSMGECGGGDDDAFSSGGETTESISTLVVATDLVGYVLCAPFQIGKNIAFPQAAAAAASVPALTEHAHTTTTATTADS
jgi:hypothetical protein